MPTVNSMMNAVKVGRETGSMGANSVFKPAPGMASMNQFQANLANIPGIPTGKINGLSSAMGSMNSLVSEKLMSVPQQMTVAQAYNSMKNRVAKAENPDAPETCSFLQEAFQSLSDAKDKIDEVISDISAAIGAFAHELGDMIGGAIGAISSISSAALNAINAAIDSATSKISAAISSLRASIDAEAAKIAAWIDELTDFSFMKSMFSLSPCGKKAVGDFINEDNFDTEKLSKV